MIPLKLTLENFKCYRAGAPVLHLEGVHLACLCGGNGHGKSSLLDAMTWALWGDEVHRPQEELVHVGESDMRVELEFLAGGHGAGQRYRVIRRYARGRSGRAGATSLELHVAQDEGGGQWRSISGSSVRETQAHITRMVGMDYSTFVNSAFLVQGRADTFTTQTPAERQRVLGRVLDLERYDHLQERAKDKARERASQMLSLQGQLQAWGQQLAQKPGHEEEAPRVEAALAGAGAQLEASEQALAVLRDQTAALRERRREMDTLERQSQASQEDLRRMASQQTQHQRRLAAWEALLAREMDIAAAYSRLQEQRQRDEALNRLVDPYGRLQERRGSIQQRVQALPRHEAALAAAQRDLERLSQRESELETRRQELQGLDAERQGLASANERLMLDMQNLRKKVDMLAQGDARCPLCGTELGVDGRQHIAGEYEAQGKVMAQEHRQNQVRLRELEPRCKEIEAWLRKEEREVAEGRRGTLAKAGALSQQTDDARKAPAELTQIEQELAALGYDPSLHRQVREAIGSLAASEEEHRLLQEAVRNLPEEREALARMEEMVARRRQALAQDAERATLLLQELAALPVAEGRLRETEAACAEAQAKHRQLLQRKGFLEERLREYAALDRQKAEAETRLAAALEERQVYDELATAFGRTGVQALIIEAAIPQLEAFANELLGRMTDNTMHLRLETQRETQRGAPVETLEIKVADPLGTRSYETFSGGEAFRINLALRIGLSKLLAHRAGAPLPTLFIDEGFGTQDAAGRERILEVVQSIAEDFQCILVITHMDEVKDAFPVRIEVQKTEAGSTFAMA
ncbi:MAG: SMC family ATPase [Chloroflexi bacterium]|nr:SMC family ATPase [Chloroflexota bacterium]